MGILLGACNKVATLDQKKYADSEYVIFEF